MAAGIKSIVQKGVWGFSWILMLGMIVFAWPMVLVQCKWAYGDDLTGQVLAYQVGFLLFPLYVMFLLRNYAAREPCSFLVRRYVECVQYSALVALWIGLAQPIHMNEIGVTSDEDRILKTWLQACWSRGLPMFLGLNFTLLDRKPFQQISFTSEGWQKAPVLNGIVMFLLCFALCCQAWIVTDEKWASESFVALFALLSIVNVVQEVARLITGKNIHVHHFYVGAMCASLCWGNHPFSLFLSHLFWGVYVEGVAAWGRDPVFGESS